ncbi:hypothetical protein V2J09_011544 [Rumex salicifolius]
MSRPMEEDAPNKLGRGHWDKVQQFMPITGARLHQTLFYSSFIHAIDTKSRMPTIGGEMDGSLYVDMPMPHRRKAERKPYPTPMKVLIKRAKEESQLRKANPCRVLDHPPDNGLLVPELIHVARRPRVVHDERSMVPRIPAVLELCIQAGVNLNDYPTKRRTKPVYCIEGRIVDFYSSQLVDFPEEHIHSTVSSYSNGETLMDISKRTMAEWFEMVNGTRKMMDRYKGPKVRMCKASKHRTQDRMHAWQEATVEDLVGPNYVWHVRDPCGPPLDSKLKRYYGKAPALVELCVQGGADVPDEYRSMMRLDVVPPDCDEVGTFM